ncbi:MAG: UDP-N-acetylmuramoyl-tripeptide--D-alanyl-D-alanine ligase [Gammaproteobacteria bacterium]|nr:UDP-N-acetylmuramoyl-tripeptide--D-alanyl-D-alanine ligase [Gammaproteobacteria bacterium]
MIKMHLGQAAQAVNGTVHGANIEFIGAHNDTRALQPGNLYIAIKGEQFDGHDFLDKAQAAGAVAALVTHHIDHALPQIVVADTQLAMGQLAKHWRQQFKIPFVGITGSVGKTTTRQMIGAIVSERGNTLISEGNKNNQFGVPLTLFRLGPEHKFAVIEMGADRPGDITYLTDIVQPQVAVITMVAPVHLEVKAGIGFGTIEGVLKEKTQIFSQLPENGTAILNADSPYYDYWHKLLTKQHQISFGMQKTADVYATDLVPNDHMQYEFTLHTPAGKQEIHLSSIGKHNVNNAVAASAAALALGFTLDEIQAGLAKVPVVERRMLRKKGINGAIVIDDSYNANVIATKAIIDMLADYKDKKRIMVFGDMRELGKISQEEHRKIGEHAKKMGIEYLLAYGPESKATVAAMGKNAEHFDSHEQLVAALQPLMNEHAIVVVKGSYGMHMDKIVQAIVEEN